MTMSAPEPQSNSLRTDELTGHVYDGIEEYDNPTPGWWTWLFVGSTFFAFIYVLIYHVGSAPGVLTRFETAQNANFLLQFGDDIITPDAVTLVEKMSDEKALQIGQATFESNCAQCHGRSGGGLSGANLTDDLWKNVSTIEDIPTVINQGAANNAMPAWQDRLHPNAIVFVAAYVASLRGTDPGAGARQGEGKAIPPWPSLEELQATLASESDTSGSPPADGESTENETSSNQD